MLEGQQAIDGAVARAADAAAPTRVGRRAAINFHLFVATGFLFLLPNAIFATAFRPAPAAVVLLGCGVIASLLWRAPRMRGILAAPVDLATYGGCLGLGAAVCVLGGEGHFFYTPVDWLTRDAVLADLVKNGFTVLYRYDDQDYLLRAPLGMYLAPALVGRAFGLYAAHMALLAQNAFLVGAIAYFVALLADVRRVPMLIIFFAFSGLDIVPVLIAEAIELLNSQPFKPFVHIEWWGEYYSTIRLQYSSHVTQLFWVPNHMAPGWWFAVLALLHARREVDLATLLVSFAAMALWSPLSMIGATPFLALFALASLPRALFAPRNFIAAGAGFCLIPIALYLTLDAAEVPHEFLPKRDGFWLRWLTFLAIETPQVAIVAYAWRKVAASDRRLLLLAFALLAVIPLYSVGTSNDFAMRASIPALFLLAFAFSRVAVLTPRDNGPFATIIGVIVIVSFATPMLELKQAFRGSYAISDCNMLTNWGKGDVSALPTNYWARAEKAPAWLMTSAAAAALTIEDRKCWPDHPLLIEEMK